MKLKSTGRVLLLTMPDDESATLEVWSFRTVGEDVDEHGVVVQGALPKVTATLMRCMHQKYAEEALLLINVPDDLFQELRQHMEQAAGQTNPDAKAELHMFSDIETVGDIFPLSRLDLDSLEKGD